MLERTDILLSENISLLEIEHSARALREGIDNSIPLTPTMIRRLFLMAVRFEAVRKCLGGKPLIITSGYRSDALNAVTPGAAYTSRHRRLLALDVRPRMSIKTALRRVQKLPFVTYAYRNSARSFHYQWDDILKEHGR